MRRFERLPAPRFLLENGESWGSQWELRRNQNPSASFFWNTHEGETINKKLLPILKEQVQSHCSFCDNFPVSPPSLDTIEHFKPKSRFPRDAFRWENLYYCCSHCQAKGEQFDDALLAPDGDRYLFEKYFIWDFTSGELNPNPKATPEDQLRAKLTIDLYRLNIGHPQLRRRELYRRSKMPSDPLDDFAYRDFVSWPTN